MVALSRQPGRRLRLKDRAVVANGSLSRLSHVISRLERQGWVRRVSGAKGRATNAELTDEGYRKLMEAGPIHFQHVRRARIRRPAAGGGEGARATDQPNQCRSNSRDESGTAGAPDPSKRASPV